MMTPVLTRATPPTEQVFIGSKNKHINVTLLIIVVNGKPGGIVVSLPPAVSLPTMATIQPGQSLLTSNRVQPGQQRKVQVGGGGLYSS